MIKLENKAVKRKINLKIEKKYSKKSKQIKNLKTYRKYLARLLNLNQIIKIKKIIRKSFIKKNNLIYKKYKKIW